MPDQPQSNVSTLLEAVHAGHAGARDQLGQLVYAELRRIAGGLMRGERPDHTLQPTALVHEAFLRLLDRDALQKMNCRSYFFAAASNAMRQVLVDHARERAAQKRGGGWQRLPLDDVLDQFEQQHVDILALHDALNELATLHERQGQVVELRYFAGHTVAETAELLGVSVSVVEDDYRKALAFLRGRLVRGD